MPQNITTREKLCYARRYMFVVARNFDKCAFFIVSQYWKYGILYHQEANRRHWVICNSQEIEFAEFEPGSYYDEDDHSSTEQKTNFIVRCQRLITYCLLRLLLREMISLHTSHSASYLDIGFCLLAICCDALPIGAKSLWCCNLLWKFLFFSGSPM